MAEALSDSYITLTPTAASDSSRGASDVLARKWAAAAKRKASMEVLKVREPECEDASDRDSSRTETDRSSEIGNDEAPSSDDGDDVSSSSRAVLESDDEDAGDEDSDEEDEQEETPTYVCGLHDPKPVLVGEFINSLAGCLVSMDASKLLFVLARSSGADPLQPRGRHAVRSEQRTPGDGGGGAGAADVRVLAVQGADSI